jgi:hypothetical protein
LMTLEARFSRAPELPEQEEQQGRRERHRKRNPLLRVVQTEEI